MKRIVICADGTWNKPERVDKTNKRREKDGKELICKPSNVVKIVRAIKPEAEDGTPQVVFYDPGVGTGWGLLDPLIGGAFGQGLSANILDCYRFLVNNYQKGDEIYLFGFSRGAFTVRSLAGFIKKCGLLPKQNVYWIRKAYELYRLKTGGGAESSSRHPKVEEFREKNEIQETSIKFIGVWDTVGALGIPFGGIFFRRLNRKYAFHDVKIGDHIENAYQALAIDEKRKAFRPTLWQEKGFEGQTLEQVWFAGCHINIGGGCDPDGLANCAFQWMVEKARLKGKGLEFNQDYISYFKRHPESRLCESYKGFWKILGKYIRPIGKTADGCESVDGSVQERWDFSPLPDGREKEYRPKNLKEYLNRE